MADDWVTDTFGMIVAAVAVLFVIREHMIFRHRTEADRWLYTARRYRRRILIALVLAATGVLMVFEARGIIPIRDVRFFTGFVFSITISCLLLVVLAAMDVIETARSAVEYSIRESKQAFEERQEELRQLQKLQQQEKATEELPQQDKTAEELLQQDKTAE